MDRNSSFSSRGKFSSSEKDSDKRKNIPRDSQENERCNSTSKTKKRCGNNRRRNTGKNTFNKNKHESNQNLSRGTTGDEKYVQHDRNSHHQTGRQNKRNDSRNTSNSEKMHTFDRKCDENSNGSNYSKIVKTSIAKYESSDEKITGSEEPEYQRSDRGRDKNDERERELYKKLSEIHVQNYQREWNTSKWGPKPCCARRGADDHYIIWRNTYDDYLWEIFDRVAGKINDFKNFRGKELDFGDFAEFAYEFSSGYITPYA